MTEIKGKYFSPAKLILSNINLETISYSASTTICQGFGIKKGGFLLNNLYWNLKNKQCY